MKKWEIVNAYKNSMQIVNAYKSQWNFHNPPTEPKYKKNPGPIKLQNSRN